MEETTLQEILESTVAVARGLEALQSEHEALLTDYYASENIDSSEGTVASSTTTDWSCFPFSYSPDLFTPFSWSQTDSL